MKKLLLAAIAALALIGPASALTANTDEIPAEIAAECRQQQACIERMTADARVVVSIVLFAQRVANDASVDVNTQAPAIALHAFFFECRKAYHGNWSLVRYCVEGRANHYLGQKRGAEAFFREFDDKR